MIAFCHLQEKSFSVTPLRFQSETWQAVARTRVFHDKTGVFYDKHRPSSLLNIWRAGCCCEHHCSPTSHLMIGPHAIWTRNYGWVSVLIAVSHCMCPVARGCSEHSLVETDPSKLPKCAMTRTEEGFFMFVLMWHSSPPADTQKEHCKCKYPQMSIYNFLTSSICSLLPLAFQRAAYLTSQESPWDGWLQSSNEDLIPLSVKLNAFCLNM